MTRKRHALMAFLLLAALALQAQRPPRYTTIHGYVFTTGVDYGRWLPGASSRTQYSGQALINPNFPLYFFGSQYYVSTVTHGGRFYLGAGATSFHPYIQGWHNFDPGNDFLLGLHPSFFRFGVMQHVTVFDGYSSGYHSNPTRSWQITFNREEESFMLIYGPPADSVPDSVRIEIRIDSSRMIAIDPRTHTVSPAPLADLSGAGWPGAYRWYKFMPECHLPQTLRFDSASFTSAWLSWSTDTGYWYGLYLDSALDGHIDTAAIRWTQDNRFRFDSLQPGTRYRVYLVSPCYPDADTSVLVADVSTRCPALQSGRIDYDVHSPAASCRRGTFDHPSWWPGIRDYGPASIFSQHTMHCVPGETDPRTGHQLSTIPQGYLSSVRLGNWDVGAQQEDITYTLQVDTADYDLLLLRYALVEQQPNHGPAYNPKFLYSINDDRGNLISSCYYSNFVSGDTSEWNHYTPLNESIVIDWKDWTAVGIDLDPFHGQTIQVNLSNYDCWPGGHYGYAYFVLDGTTKHLNSETCGDASVSKFRAPEGFRYHWYPEGHPEDTLSAADTLEVVAEGNYCCRVSYLTDSSCGFTMHTYAGPRYPHAAFAAACDDSCRMVVHFDNSSRIARDTAGTRLSDLSCDSYLWRFGDGDTSVEASPTHCYREPGTYAVVLCAMLGNGSCIDSLTQTVTVSMPVDESCDTICLGESRLFHGDTLTAEGTYLYVESCRGDRLRLCVRQPAAQRPGAEVCCDDPAGYRFALADTLHYRFSAFPPDAAMPQGVLAGTDISRWTYMPPDTLALAVTTGYGPRLVCPVADTFWLAPFAPVRIRLDITPVRLSPGNSIVTVRDRSDSAWLRQWYVNGELQDESGPQLRFESSLSGDSVRIRLVASNDYCSDTAYAAIPIQSGSPCFPNVFTPGVAPNDCFRGYGVNIRDYQLEIYTRWGDCFFRTNDINESWDGTRNGRRCPEGAYAYLCRYTTPDGKPATLSGTVLLLR